MRRDRPNGKRCAARSRTGALVTAYGFDLRSLLLHAPAIEAAAGEVEAEVLALRQCRAETIVALRDATKLAVLLEAEDLAPRLEAARTVLRRRLGLAELDALAQALAGLVEEMRGRLAPTEEMSGSDGENERHQQSQIQMTHDSDFGREDREQDRPPIRPGADAAGKSVAIPLELVLKACPEVLTYAERRPRHWPDLVRLAERLRAYMGVAASTWSEAQSRMGPELASATLAVLLQRFAEIRNPGGYLRHLTRRHAEGRLSLGSMIHALLGRQAAVS